MSFTRRGWILLAATVAMIAAARLLGLPQLLVIGAALLCLLVICAVWTATRSDLLVASRDLPERIHVGGDGRVDLTVVNEASQTSPTVAFTDDFDGGERSARFLLPPLDARSTARAAYRVPTDTRGRHELGPLVAMIGDPFGIARRSWEAAGRREIIVHPRVHDIVPLPELGAETFIAHNVLSPYRDVVLREFQSHKVPLRMEVEMPTIETIRKLVQNDVGVAFLPRMCVEQEIEQGLLCEVKVKEMHVERKIRLIYPTRRALSHAAKAFLEVVG